MRKGEAIVDEAGFVHACHERWNDIPGNGKDRKQEEAAGEGKDAFCAFQKTEEQGKGEVTLPLACTIPKCSL
ncbi:hypothetical protein BS17DRAFT_780039 [Gyrodon lividus]|nr:hypothetical protein BS17DRAFT_780039 [Gyrodon lividus]